MDDDRQGERWIAAVHFSGDKKNEVNSKYKLLKYVEYIKWFPQVDLLPISAIPGLDNRGAIATNCNAKMQTYEIYKKYFNDGQYRTHCKFRYENKKYTKNILYDGQ